MKIGRRPWPTFEAETPNRLLWVDEDPAADEAAVTQVPDPGGRHVSDAEGPAAQVDPALHEQRVPTRLDMLGRDQQVLPDRGHVLEVCPQPLYPDVGLAAADLLCRDRVELHPLVAEPDHPIDVAAVEGIEESLDGFAAAVIRGRLRTPPRRQPARRTRSRGRGHFASWPKRVPGREWR